MRHIVISIGLVALAVALVLTGCNQKVGDAGDPKDTHAAQTTIGESTLVFTPITLDTKLEMVTVKPASSPGEFIILCNNLEAPREALYSIIEVKLEAHAASLTVLNSSAKRVIPEFLTGEGFLLDTDMDIAGVNNGGRQFNKSAFLLDAALTKRNDITPANYSEITQSSDDKETKYSCSALWDHQVGLVVFGWDSGNRLMKVWVGKKELTVAGSAEGIFSNAKLYLNGRFTYGGITQDGKLFAYDFTKHKFGHIAEYNSIASALSRVVTARDGKLVRCTLTKNFAMYGGQPINVINSSGKVWSYNKVHSLDYRPDGSKRPEREANELIEGRMRNLLKKEAAKLPPQFLSSHSQQVALNDNAIGMLDTLYSRLVVITVE